MSNTGILKPELSKSKCSGAYPAGDDVKIFAHSQKSSMIFSEENLSSCGVLPPGEIQPAKIFTSTPAWAPQVHDFPKQRNISLRINILIKAYCIMK